MDTLNEMQSTAYNKIHLNTPNVFVNDKRVVSSEFFSVDATTLRGISAEINDESEQLYELLLNNFDEKCFSPSITCWVTSYIKPSILEQLEEIFNYEHIAESEVIEVVEPIDGIVLSSDHNTVTERGHDGNDAGRSGDDRSDGGRSGGDNSGDDDKYISVSSVAHVGTKDHIQTLDTRTHFHAKIDQIDQKFFINVDVTCGLNEMLSTKWKQLAQEGYGYSLESLRIEIVPIASENYRGALIWEDCLFPEEIVTTISDEWKLRIAGTCATGYIWHYELKSDDPKLEFRAGSHICGGRIVSEKLCGFRVRVTEILRFKFTSYIPKPSRYRFMKCPKIAHVLEMTFNDLKDFNKKFATLGCYTGDVDEDTFLVSDMSHNKTTTTNSGIADFFRTFR
ncbi:hypothetical protein C1646_663973 [Rhizophagus diaphanus]|nr:hypothetical protein C1646_663973 [Rhizophagus diaphanus] [Rhizophagus sp. MUCL 43196]